MVNSVNPLLEIEGAGDLSSGKNYKTEGEYEQTLIQTFRLRTFEEFKQFFEQNLLKDLRVFEKRRKQSLATILVCTVTALISLLLIFQLSPNKFFQPVWSYDDIISFPLLFTSFNTSLSWLQDMVGLLVLSVIYVSIIGLVFILYLLFYNSTYKCFIYKFDDMILQRICNFINTNNSFSILTAFPNKEKHQTLTEINNSQLLKGLLEPNYIEQKHLIRGSINNIDIKIATVEIVSLNNRSLRNIFNIFNLSKKRQDKTSIPLISFFAAIILLVIRLFKGIPYIFTRMVSGKNLDFQRFMIEILKNTNYQNQAFKGLFFTAKLNHSKQALTIIKPKSLKDGINLLYTGKNNFSSLNILNLILFLQLIVKIY
ncbi:MAG: hypothetical protein MJK14_20750 [Rivularia sp. ALOHA_DT_140]|nr:hypothetical protein [Rivularia sp. ALOHA_DT_140]